jgi:hypothetical protein
MPWLDPVSLAGVSCLAAVATALDEKSFILWQTHCQYRLTNMSGRSIESAMSIGYAAKIPFSHEDQQEISLHAYGVNNIYVEGRGGETLDEAIKWFRGKPGELHVYGGLRVLGGSREKIVKIVKDLKRLKIVVIDEMNKERSDRHETEMFDRALRQILGSNKVKRSRKFARAIGAKGGKGKLESMKAKRMPEVIARPIWLCSKLTAQERLRLMNPPCFELQWSEATAYRHLGTQL